jgi:hypothetical protein
MGSGRIRSPCTCAKPAARSNLRASACVWEWAHESAHASVLACAGASKRACRSVRVNPCTCTHSTRAEVAAHTLRWQTPPCQGCARRTAGQRLGSAKLTVTDLSAGARAIGVGLRHAGHSRSWAPAPQAKARMGLRSVSAGTHCARWNVAACCTVLRHAAVCRGLLCRVAQMNTKLHVRGQCDRGGAKYHRTLLGMRAEAKERAVIFLAQKLDGRLVLSSR